MNDFVAHTEEDVRSMLGLIGAGSVDELFASVPAGLRDPVIELAAAMSEPEVVAHLSDLASRNDPSGGRACFLGGGIYDRYVPACVRAIVSRGEFATAYTPYQAEASQGTLQALFEFQTMVASLLGLDVANASMYDAGTGLVEAVNLVAPVNGHRRVLVTAGTNPRYRRVLETYGSGLGLDIEVLPENDFGTEPGAVAEALRDEPALALVVQQPNFYGVLEEAADLAEAARDGGSTVIGVTDPVACGVIEPPGAWGAQIAVAEGQALGNPMALAGQCVGLFACEESLVRRMPGRLVGETTDAEGRRGFVLTLQAREQHIRREKAGSNICTNQTLFALAVAVHLAWLGPDGLKRAAELGASYARLAAARIEAETPFRLATTRDWLSEFPLTGPRPGAEIVADLRDRGIWAGPVSTDHPDVFNVAFTERRTESDIDLLVAALAEVGK